MATNKINYDARDFDSIREELLNFIQQNYPEIFPAINDASIGEMLVELNAAVGNMLSFNTDRMFQETQLDNAQIRRNVVAIAKNLGVKLKGKKASVTLMEFKVNIPPLGESYDPSYLPVLGQGTQIRGSDKIFENISEVDFSSDFSAEGIPNRRINPLRNGDGTVREYEIIKNEIVVNGQTKILKKVLTATDIKTFLEVILPEGNSTVISVEQVISLDGTNITTEPTIDQFLDPANRWYEVDSLGEQRIFLEDGTTDAAGFRGGRWVQVDKKFTVDYDDNGFCRVTFGSGTNSGGAMMDSSNLLNNIIVNNALGIAPRANTTLFIRYRVGGGSSANLGKDIIKNLENVNMTVNGVDPSKNKNVRNSLRATNITPSIGGGDEMGVEEIRKYASYNYSAQNRAVTVPDYISKVLDMPGKYGTPFRVNGTEQENKIKMYLLFRDSNGKLTNTSTTLLKNNVANWLSYFRMLNDYVEVNDGQIYNLGVDIYAIRDQAVSKPDVAANIISQVTTMFDIRSNFMGSNIFVGEIVSNIIKNVMGVRNVYDVKIYNKIGSGGATDYSTNRVLQQISNEDTGEILLVNQTLYGNPYGMYEIKFPSKDIRIFMN